MYPSNIRLFRLFTLLPFQTSDQTQTQFIKYIKQQLNLSTADLEHYKGLQHYNTISLFMQTRRTLTSDNCQPVAKHRHNE